LTDLQGLLGATVFEFFVWFQRPLLAWKYLKLVM
jgi:hypothetical protein